MATIDLEGIWRELQKAHNVHSRFYEVVDLADLPRGPLSEVDNICHVLQAEGLPCTAENVFLVMQSRRQLILLLHGKRNVQRAITEISKGKAGFTGNATYDLAIILTPLILFGNGFFTRAGARFFDYLVEYLAKRGLKETDTKVIAKVVVQLTFKERNGFRTFRVRSKWKVRRTGSVSSGRSRDGRP